MYDALESLLTEIAAGEDTYLELKEVQFAGRQVRLGSAGRAAPELAEVLCSMVNTEGGVLVLGVRKDSTIAGIDPEKREILEQFVVNVATSACIPQIEPLLNWLYLPDAGGQPHLCLKVDLPKARYSVHQTSDGRFLKRIGSHRHIIPAEQLGRLLATRNLLVPFEERPAHGSSLDQIDPARVAAYYRRRFAAEPPRDPSDYVRFLLNIKLATDLDGDAVPTNLGLLLFAEHPEERISGAYVDLGVYKGAAANGETSDSKRISGPISEQIHQVLRYFQTSPLIATESHKGGMGRVDLPTYVGRALQEAIVNALVHRDYEIAGSQVIVRLFPDRIEVQNPGGLHNTLTEENLYAGCQPVRRNQNLAGFLRDFPSPLTGTSFMEARGEGFLSLVRESLALSGRRPDIRRIGQAVKLTVYARPADPDA